MVKGIMIAEGEFEDYVERETTAELRAFADGFAAGGSAYGAGSAYVLTRDDLSSLSPANKYEAKDIALINKYLPEAVSASS